MGVLTPEILISPFPLHPRPILLANLQTQIIAQQSVFLMLPADRKGYGSTGEYFPLELMVMVMFIFQVKYLKTVWNTV